MQAMIITAYKDYNALVRVVRALSAHALCLVHVDARSAITSQQAPDERTGFSPASGTGFSFAV